jgi:hypothetical protein
VQSYLNILVIHGKLKEKNKKKVNTKFYVRMFIVIRQYGFMFHAVFLMLA